MWGCHAAGAWDWGAQERSLERRAADERIGDGERSRVVDALGAHLSAGRLEIDEFEQRTDDALHARTRRDLDPLLADLPPVTITDPAARDRARAAFTRHAVRFAAIAVALVWIWSLTGASFFWPMWPLAWLGFGLLGHAARARDAGTVVVRGRSLARSG